MSAYGGGIVTALRALFGLNKIDAPIQLILAGGPPGRNKERVHGRRISRRRMLRAPKAWHPVLVVKDDHIVDEYWEHD